MKTSIKIINFLSTEYFLELALRNDILRKPLGLSFSLNDLKEEETQIHIGAFYESKLIGCLLLKVLDSENIQMRQVAVDEKFRAKGIGKDMVLFSEEYSHKLGYNKIILHARDTAIKFYEKLDYKKVGEQFIEVTIPHLKMEKHI